MVILLVTDYALDVVLFETISAFATVGLSTGITPDLPPAAESRSWSLMFVGRVGTITVASALALKCPRTATSTCPRSDPSLAKFRNPASGPSSSSASAGSAQPSPTPSSGWATRSWPSTRTGPGRDRWADELTHVAQADTTDDQALRQLGVADFDRAVVAIGTDIEASVLTVLALAEAGVPDIWAKAITRKHGPILERVGAHHVVYPEFSMGERVAHMLTGGMMDYIEFDDEFSIARTLAPALHLGQDAGRVGTAQQTRRHHRRRQAHREDFTYARPETIVSRHDHLIVSGPTRKVEKFCNIR